MTSTKSGFRQTLLVALSTLLFAVAAQAGTVSFGPTPYLHGDEISQDTPDGFFDFSHPDCVGWIEDFEAGTYDAFLSFDVGEVLAPFSTSGAPSSVTDSVDGDDGAIDGNGNGGYSYFASKANSITITFADVVHAAGLVFTDGDRASTNILLAAHDVDGNLLGTIDAGDLADDTYTGETAEDRFLGFTDDMTGIGSITLTMVGGSGIEIDHVHWQTECVPEPATGLMAFFGLMGLIGLRRRR